MLKVAFPCNFTFLSSGSVLELTINLVELQKEKERLEEEAKKERKRERKEKKKEKKEKRSGQEHELSKELKKSLKRKYEELGLVESKDKHDGTQHHHQSKKPRDEQMARSGLTEEHGQPSTGIANSESPERSQDSSKRRNSGSMPSPSLCLTNSGMP
jgi:predicted phage gp36 major capsid-like protein